MLRNILKEDGLPACVLSCRYFVQRYKDASGSEKLRVHTFCSGQNGEERTFEVKRAATVEVEEAGGSQAAGSKRISVEEEDEIRCDQVPGVKKLRRTEDDDERGAEFQFAVDPCRNELSMF